MKLKNMQQQANCLHRNMKSYSVLEENKIQNRLTDLFWQSENIQIIHKKYLKKCCNIHYSLISINVDRLNRRGKLGKILLNYQDRLAVKTSFYNTYL